MRGYVGLTLIALGVLIACVGSVILYAIGVATLLQGGDMPTVLLIVVSRKFAAFILGAFFALIGWRTIDS